MKPLNILFPVLALSIIAADVFMFGGCKKSDAELHPAIYMTGTRAELTGTPSITAASYSANSTGNAFAFSASASSIVTQDATVKFAADTSLVKGYNLSTGANYALLPTGSYALSGTSAIIKTGTNVSGSLELVINSLTDIKEGINYLLPITITDATGGLPLLQSRKTLYAIITRPIITVAPSLHADGNCFKVDFSTDNTTLKSMPAVSYECRVNMTAFPVYTNGNLMGVMGGAMNSDAGTPWLMVDGTPDRTHVQDTHAFYFCNIGWQQVTGALAYPSSLNTWYHVACVYNNGTLTIYVNGQLISTASYPAAPVDLTSAPFYIGGNPGNQNGFYLNGAVSELRVWSKALTQKEIQNNMCAIDPASPNLEAYWKANEDTGNTLTDYTGHGHTATFTGSTIDWMQNVACP